MYSTHQSKDTERLYEHTLVAQTVKRLPTMWETWVWSLGQEDPLEKEMATHSSTLAWKIPWTEEQCKLQSTGLQRVGHDWAMSLKHSINLQQNTHSSQVHWEHFPGFDTHMMVANQILENLKRLKSYKLSSSDHNDMKLEINNRRKVRSTSMWKLNKNS